MASEEGRVSGVQFGAVNAAFQVIVDTTHLQFVQVDI